MYYLAEFPGKKELLSVAYFYYVHQCRALGKKNKTTKQEGCVYPLFSPIQDKGSFKNKLESIFEGLFMM